jgi:hypothetical protein
VEEAWDERLLVVAFVWISMAFVASLITQQQYSELVTVVILSALVPTIMARQFFRLAGIDEEEEEALGAEDATTIRREAR